MFSRINGSGSTNHVTTSNMIFTTQTDPASTIDPKLQVLRDPEYAELLTRHVRNESTPILWTECAYRIPIPDLSAGFWYSWEALNVQRNAYHHHEMCCQNRFRGTIRRIVTHPGFSLIEVSFRPVRSLAHCARHLFHSFCSVCASFDVALRRRSRRQQPRP